MVNIDLKLNSKLFNKDAEKFSMRQGFGEGLVVAGEFSDRVVALCADVTESVSFNVFRDRFPKRFVEIGVAEQNMAGVASGLAAMGKIPFMGTYAVFSPGRNWEQIRTTICYNNQPVKIVGSHGGVTVGPDGGSHKALEDISLMRVLPRMIVLSPCDAIEAGKVALAAAETNTPVYIRLSRESLPNITTEDTPFKIGKAEIFYDSLDRVYSPSSVGIVATGNMVYRTMLAAEILRNENIGVRVLNLSTIKPLDAAAILRLAKETGAIVTVEDHQVAGGMGSAVAEFLAENNPVPMEFVGVRDLFGQSGTPEQLLKYYGLSEDSIVAAAKKVLDRKAK